MTKKEWFELIIATLTIANSLLLTVLKSKVQEVHLSLNSRLEELIKSTRESSHAEGVASEVARAKAEIASNSLAIIKSESKQS